MVLPIHPRTRQKLQDYGLLNPVRAKGNLKLIDPVTYLDMLILEQNSRMILTDSGGVQKEAFFFAVPCLTLRPETEWVETTQCGWNLLVGTDRDRILSGLRYDFPAPNRQPALFGSGQSAQAIVQFLEKEK